MRKRVMNKNYDNYYIFHNQKIIIVHPIKCLKVILAKDIEQNKIGKALTFTSSLGLFLFAWAMIDVNINFAPNSDK